MRNIFQYICYKRSIALITLIPYGLQNGATKLFLAITRVIKQGYVYFLITILIFKSKRSLLNPRGVSSSASCDIKTNETNLILANIYVPNEDNPAFFFDLFDYLADFKGEDIILGGDYNLVLDLDKDKRGSLSKTHGNSGKIVQEFCDKLDLVDIWTVLKPDSNSFTWIQRHPRMQCRLDFFLVSQSTANITTSADIVPGYKTALSMITVHLSLHSIPRGAGFWKLNTSFLAELEYVNQFSNLCVYGECFIVLVWTEGLNA